VTHNKGSGSQFGESVYIFEVNGARKITSKAQVAMKKNSDPVQKLFPYGWLGDSAPTQFFRTSGIVRNESSWKLIFGLQINIGKHKANSRRYDVTR